MSQKRPAKTKLPAAALRNCVSGRPRYTEVPPNAHLLLAADCTPFVCGAFHRDFIKGRVVVNACPKRDNTSPSVDTLAAMIATNDILSVTALIMDVPCCRGQGLCARQAIPRPSKQIPLEIVLIGVDGERKSEHEDQRDPSDDR